MLSRLRLPRENLSEARYRSCGGAVLVTLASFPPPSSLDTVHDPNSEASIGTSELRLGIGAEEGKRSVCAGVKELKYSLHLSTPLDKSGRAVIWEEPVGLPFTSELTDLEQADSEGGTESVVTPDGSYVEFLSFKYWSESVLSCDEELVPNPLGEYENCLDCLNESRVDIAGAFFGLDMEVLQDSREDGNAAAVSVSTRSAIPRAAQPADVRLGDADGWLKEPSTSRFSVFALLLRCTSPGDALFVAARST